MSKPIFFLFSILLVNLSAPAQVLVHQFFPMGINGDMLGDTMLNKRETLSKAGIRKITVLQVSPVVSTTFKSKTYAVNQNGNIESLRTCFSNPKSDSGFCLKDTCFYNSQGQFIKLKSYDGKGAMYLQYFVEWLNNSSAKCYSIVETTGDSLIDYKYYDDKGRLQKQTSIRKNIEPQSCFYFFNKDGLLDSVRYENSQLPTTVFKRTQQKKNKLVEMEHQKGKISWTYNASGQCIRTTYFVKNPAPMVGQPYVFTKKRPEYVRKMDTLYYYNSDGTLSKITEKSEDGPELTVLYSYEK